MTSLIKYTFFVFLALASGCYAQKFRFDYEWSDEAGGWLKYHVVPVTWDKARLRCHAEGAILASPLTDKLKTAIVSFVKKQNVSHYVQEVFNLDVGVTIFTGVHATFSEGDYSSIEGVPLLRLAITWEPGQPDNHENAERCLAMVINHNGTVGDTRCDRVLPYVCYKKDPELMKMSECGTTDPEYLLNPKTGSCYKFHKQGLPWSEAYMTCVAEGGYLAVINNDMEAEVIRDIIGINTYLTYIGFHDWGHYGSSFMTIHGESLDVNYNNWFEVEPNNGSYAGSPGLGEYCGSAYSDVTLNDCFCDLSKPFLCEKSPYSLM